MTDKEADELFHAAYSEYAALLSVTPTTAAGCTALLRYVEACEVGHEAGLFNGCPSGGEDCRRRLLSLIAATLEAG